MYRQTHSVTCVTQLQSILQATAIAIPAACAQGFTQQPEKFFLYFNDLQKGGFALSYVQKVMVQRFLASDRDNIV